MVDHPTTDIAPAMMRKRRFGLLAVTICGVAAIASVGLFGRFDLSVGLDKTWAGPVRFGINGAVGDDAKADTAVTAPPSQAVSPTGGPTSAELAAYEASQRELGAALQDLYRSAGSAISDSGEIVEAADSEPQSYRETAAAMRETAAKLRRQP